MIDRICISINNRCNLKCAYCHFREKNNIREAKMDVFQILDNVKKYARHPFKIGFVGNGEAFLDWDNLKSYISYLNNDPIIGIYTITNGTVSLTKEDLLFLEERKVNVGFSIDGYKELHDKNRCGSFEKALQNVEMYREVTGHYPTFNATVGMETLANADRVIDFFRPFGTRVTFSRMIGEKGITLDQYHDFLNNAEKVLAVRKGGTDCTMYGGRCGAGTNNYFFANGKVFLCGNCIDMPPIADSNISLWDLEKIHYSFDRNHCYKELI